MTFEINLFGEIVVKLDQFGVFWNKDGIKAYINKLDYTFIKSQVIVPTTSADFLFVSCLVNPNSLQLFDENNPKMAQNV